MMRLLGPLVAAIVALGALTTAASAEIEVRPQRVAAGEDITFVLRMHSLWPNADTRGVKVQFPEEVSIRAFGAPPLGWSQKPLGERDDPTGVMYHGGVIPEGTHQDFTIVAHTDTPGRTLWLAEQFLDNGVLARYSIDPAVGLVTPEARADGVAAVVEIVGDAPVTNPVIPPAAVDLPPTSAAPQQPQEIDDAAGGDGSSLAERLGIALLIVGLFAFVVVLVLSRTNAGFTRPQQSDAL